MAFFGSFKGGGNDRPISNGEDFQCDCPRSGCPCTRWGRWVPAGKPVPDVVICDQCGRGVHTG